MEDGHFVPVTIIRAGYTRVVYRLSATVPGEWIAGFDATCWAAGADWPEGYPTAHADRIDVMLPDREHADRRALVALKTRREAATSSPSTFPPPATNPGDRGLGDGERRRTLNVARVRSRRCRRARRAYPVGLSRGW